MKAKEKKSKDRKVQVKRFPIDQPKLNLACGKNKIEGFFGIDKIMTPGLVDEVVDLTLFPWPIKSESTDEIICSHYVEHTPTDTFAKRIVMAVLANGTYDDFRKALINWDLSGPSDG